MRLANIKAAAFLKAERLATRSGANSQVFKQIKTELRKLPKVEERLTFEFFGLTWLALQSGGDPVMPAFHAFLFRDKICEDRRQEYAAWVHRIVIKTFEMIGDVGHPVDEQNPIMLTFRLSLIALRAINDVECESVANALITHCKNRAIDNRLGVINEVMESRSQMRSRLWKLAREVKVLKIQLEQAAQANLN
jgi:hypothetical protein